MVIESQIKGRFGLCKGLCIGICIGICIHIVPVVSGLVKGERNRSWSFWCFLCIDMTLLNLK